MPLDDASRLQLLAIDSTVERLRMALHCLVQRASAPLCCALCHCQIAATSDVMTVKGASGCVGA